MFLQGGNDLLMLESLLFHLGTSIGSMYQEISHSAWPANTEVRSNPVIFQIHKDTVLSNYLGATAQDQRLCRVAVT